MCYLYSTMKHSPNGTYYGKYGITYEDYLELLEEQHEKCAICGKKGNECKRYNKLSVDHDHETGVIRGLICHDCNVGLGCFNDDPELLLWAATYLARDLDGHWTGCS